MSEDIRHGRGKSWKAFQVDYDDTFARSDRTCCYALTDQQVAALLSLTEYLYWPTRWVRQDGEISADDVRQFTENLERNLMAGCCDDNLPIQWRYTAAGVLERSLNAGGNWTPAPEYDPRVYSPQFPPPSGVDGDDKKCIAATGAAALVKEQVGDQLTDGMARYTLSQLLTDWVSTYIQTSNPFQALMTVLANQIFALIIATLRPALTETVYGQLKCILYCNMGNDATINDGQWQQIRSDISEQIGGIAGIFLEHLVFMLGTGGMTNLVRAGGAATGDCSDCDECEEGGCADTWNQRDGFGTITARSGSQITALTQVAEGFGPIVAIETGGADICCILTSWENLSETSISQFQWFECGDRVHQQFSIAAPIGHCISAINVIMSAETSMIFTFDDCD